MKELLDDPVFYWSVWSAFTVLGVVVGWTLRAALSEKQIRLQLERIEQEKNTLARLYTHLKHQHELREADFKRASLELSNLRVKLQDLEHENSRRAGADAHFAIRAERAEVNAAQYAQKVSALELLNNNLRNKNAELTNQLHKMQEELDAWQLLYRDFQVLQQKLNAFEQAAGNVEQERTRLRQELERAKIEIENLQLEIVQSRHSQTEKQHTGSKRGGLAAPEITDDLKIINGISPFAEKQLHALGIYSFEQISRWDDDAIVAFAKALGLSPGKIYQDDWVGQARFLLQANA